MKRLIGVIFALCMVCIPMSIHAEDELSFEYTGSAVEIEDAYGYYSISDSMPLENAPVDHGRYYAFTSQGMIPFSILPKRVFVHVTQNPNWRATDLKEPKYLCEYQGDYIFKLGINDSDQFISSDSYRGNYEFIFDPASPKDVPVVKTKITHEDVEYVYTGNNIEIYSENKHILPIVLKDAGCYEVAFEADPTYYESIPFKVTILPKEVKVPVNSIFKIVGEKDPSFEDNEDYKIVREPGEEVGKYKLNIINKSKNYKYIPGSDAFLTINQKMEKVPGSKMDEIKDTKGSNSINEDKKDHDLKELNDPFQEKENLDSKKPEIKKEEKTILQTETKSSDSEQEVVPLKKRENVKVNTGVKDTTLTSIFLGVLSCITILFIKRNRI